MLLELASPVGRYRTSTYTQSTAGQGRPEADEVLIEVKSEGGANWDEVARTAALRLFAANRGAADLMRLRRRPAGG